MRRISKKTRVEKVIKKLKSIIIKSIEEKKLEKACAAVATCAELLYEYNQVYCDDELENYSLEISNMLFGKSIKNREITHKKRSILFYDGFGLDTRGLALIYLKGIVRNGYKLIYVVDVKARNSQEEIHKALIGYDVEWVYLDGNNSKKYLSLAVQLNKVFEKYNPTDAFFYTTPYDIAATIVFEHYKGIVKRYQINLTDHAFWLGKHTFDYCIEFRGVGSKISYNYRKIIEDEMVMLPFYATIDKDASFEGFDFNTNGYKIVFSGGALYKTLGDNENKYYQIVERLLSNFEDVLFIYAGSGDNTQLMKIVEKYPKRAFHINERKDLFQVMQQCIFYLNTYPLAGGLMMNYAATAGKLPLTLRHNNDTDGLLFKQEELGIEFLSVEELLEEAYKLLTDDKYRINKEIPIKESVITQQRFEENLRTLIENGTTEFPISIEKIDTVEFRNRYLCRFNVDKVADKIIVKMQNKILFGDFPLHFLRGKMKSIYRKFR